MRTLTDHIVNPVNDQILVEAVDEPGAGGASHRYVAQWPAKPNELTRWEGPLRSGMHGIVLDFQKGPIAEVGVNGITQEVLLAIVADRLRSFQAGPYACRENAVALTHIETAMLWLQKRTLDRMRRGVEGTSKL